MCCLFFIVILQREGTIFEQCIFNEIGKKIAQQKGGWAAHSNVKANQEIFA